MTRAPTMPQDAKSTATDPAGSREHDEPEDALVPAAELEALVRLVEEAPAPKGGRARLIGELRASGRLGAHAARVAALLDVDEASARILLDRAATPAAYEPGPFAGVSLCHIDGGPAVASAITGFVRIEGGARFPTHEHLGDETIFILQGSCLVEETGAILRAGTELRSSSDEVHATVARPGPDLVYLAIVRGGIRVGTSEFLPGDPRI